LKILATFTQYGIPKSDLTPTITIMKKLDDSVVVSAASMTSRGSGIYLHYDYLFAAVDGEDYYFVCDAGTYSVDSRYIVGTTSSILNEIEDKIDLILATIEVSEGARLLEISIVRAGTSTPIAGVFVALYPASSDVLISTGKSNISGELSFSMDDGSYRLVCYKIGYSFTNPTLVTIAGNDTIEIEGDALAIESPIPGSSCRVYEYLYDLSGITPLAEERVVGNATAYVTPFDFNEDRLVEVEAVEGTYDESTGLIYWDIAQGATVSFRIPVVGISKTVLIPDESSARLYDLTLEEEES